MVKHFRDEETTTPLHDPDSKWQVCASTLMAIKSFYSLGQGLTFVPCAAMRALAVAIGQKMKQGKSLACSQTDFLWLQQDQLTPNQDD
jgi:hypothetical protein